MDPLQQFASQQFASQLSNQAQTGKLPPIPRSNSEGALPGVPDGTKFGKSMRDGCVGRQKPQTDKLWSFHAADLWPGQGLRTALDHDADDAPAEVIEGQMRPMACSWPGQFTRQNLIMVVTGPETRQPCCVRLMVSLARWDFELRDKSAFVVAFSMDMLQSLVARGKFSDARSASSSKAASQCMCSAMVPLRQPLDEANLSLLPLHAAGGSVAVLRVVVASDSKLRDWCAIGDPLTIRLTRFPELRPVLSHRSVQTECMAQDVEVQASPKTKDQRLMVCPDAEDFAMQAQPDRHVQDCQTADRMVLEEELENAQMEHGVKVEELRQDFEMQSKRMQKEHAAAVAALKTQLEASLQGGQAQSQALLEEHKAQAAEEMDEAQRRNDEELKRHRRQSSATMAEAVQTAKDKLVTELDAAKAKMQAEIHELQDEKDDLEDALDELKRENREKGEKEGELKGTIDELLERVAQLEAGKD